MPQSQIVTFEQWQQQKDAHIRQLLHLIGSVLEAEFSLPSTDADMVGDVAAALFARFGVPTVGTPAETLAQIESNLATLHAEDPDLFERPPHWRYLARLKYGAGAENDPTDDRWAQVCAASHYATATEKRREAYTIRCKLRAAGRPIPEPRASDAGQTYYTIDRVPKAPPGLVAPRQPLPLHSQE